MANPEFLNGIRGNVNKLLGMFELFLDGMGAFAYLNVGLFNSSLLMTGSVQRAGTQAFPILWNQFCDQKPEFIGLMERLKAAIRNETLLAPAVAET